MTYSEYTGSMVMVTEGYFNVSDGVAIKIIDFMPKGDRPERPLVVFVAGWISSISGWKDMLKELTPHYRTLYVETREKKSAILPEKSDIDFSVDRMSRDIDEILRQRVPEDRPFCFVGSSLGSTVILEYLSRRGRNPIDAFVIAPNCEFPFPWWLLAAIRFIPASFYGKMKLILKWYLRNFRIDKEKEPEQAKKYEGTMDAAEPKRLQASALELSNYSLWDKLEMITAPVCIIGAKSDTLHGVEEMEKMVGLIPSARLEIMASNKETHSDKAGKFIVEAMANYH